MENNYTDFSLIKFLYQDSDITEHLETEHAIAEDRKISSRFNSFKRSISLLDSLSFSPSALSLQRIKLYSQIENVQLN